MSMTGARLRLLMLLVLSATVEALLATPLRDAGEPAASPLIN